MQTKPRHDNGAQKKIQRKVEAINEAIARFKAKRGKNPAVKELQTIMIINFKEFAARNSASLSEFLKKNKDKIKF